MLSQPQEWYILGIAKLRTYKYSNKTLHFLLNGESLSLVKYWRIRCILVVKSFWVVALICLYLWVWVFERKRRERGRESGRRRGSRKGRRRKLRLLEMFSWSGERRCLTEWGWEHCLIAADWLPDGVLHCTPHPSLLAYPGWLLSLRQSLWGERVG